MSGCCPWLAPYHRIEWLSDTYFTNRFAVFYILVMIHLGLKKGVFRKIQDAQRRSFLSETRIISKREDSGIAHSYLYTQRQLKIFHIMDCMTMFVMISHLDHG